MRSQLGRPSSSKPIPPDDLWESVDAALKEIASTPAPRPPNSFTVAEVAAHKGVSRGAAARMVRNMLHAGMAKKLGGGNKFYYVMVRK